MGIGAHYKLKHPKFSLFIYHSKEEKEPSYRSLSQQISPFPRCSLTVM